MATPAVYILLSVLSVHLSLFSGGTGRAMFAYAQPGAPDSAASDTGNPAPGETEASEPSGRDASPGEGQNGNTQDPGSKVNVTGINDDITAAPSGEQANHSSAPIVCERCGTPKVQHVE